jgi:hypothetical protein
MSKNSFANYTESISLAETMMGEGKGEGEERR